MVIKALKKSNDNLGSTIRWGAAFSQYLSKMILNLESIRENITAKSTKGDYREARSDFRQVRRCERRINQYYTRLKGNLIELLNILPSNLQVELKDIQEKLRPHEAKLIRETSFFTGEQVENFEGIGIQLQLVQREKGNPTPVQALLSKNINEFRKLEAAPGSGHSFGLIPFLAELQSLKRFIAKLEGMSK
ncbi:MAG: hypothetical protein V2A62_03415 [Candidatus Woesearchaeota archaeon]